jgi:hypothetical protein
MNVLDKLRRLMGLAVKSGPLCRRCKHVILAENHPGGHFTRDYACGRTDAWPNSDAGRAVRMGGCPRFKEAQ